MSKWLQEGPDNHFRKGESGSIIEDANSFLKITNKPYFLILYIKEVELVLKYQAAYQNYKNIDK